MKKELVWDLAIRVMIRVGCSSYVRIYRTPA